jgi:hypothetical protein
MMKKAIILGIVLSYILFAAVFSVSAVDESGNFTDPEDDVIDLLSEDGPTTSARPNIDIILIEYSISGKQVTLTLEVKGEIENKGDIENYETDFISYQLMLYTSEDAYDIIYINEECIIDGPTDEVSWDIDDSTLEFSFELGSATEAYDGLMGLTVDLDFANLKMYGDEFYDVEEEIDVDAGGDYEGKPGESIQFNGYAQGGTEPYEWSWDFDEDFLPDSNKQNPTWTFNKPGEYNITLTVSDSIGYQGVAFTSVVISGASNGNGDSEDSPLLLFVALIIVIVIAGVAVLVYVLRR